MRSTVKFHREPLSIPHSAAEKQILERHSLDLQGNSHRRELPLGSQTCFLLEGSPLGSLSSMMRLSQATNEQSQLLCHE